MCDRDGPVINAVIVLCCRELFFSRRPITLLALVLKRSRRSHLVRHLLDKMGRGLLFFRLS